jgi:hypothetical protein
MANQQIAGLAVLIALAFCLLALAACAKVEQRAEIAGPSSIVVIPPPGVPEFHGARIGADSLRSRLQAV